MPGHLRRVLFLALIGAASCSSPAATVPDDDDQDDVEPPRDEARGGRGGGGTGGSTAAGGAGGRTDGPPALRADAAAPEPVDASQPGAPAPDAAAPAVASDAAAARDTTPSTAPGLGAAPACASGKALVCEDFEAVAVGAVPAGWTRTGTVAVVAEEPARGARSLKVTGRPNSTYGNTSISRRLTIPGAHWGRIYYRVNLPAPRPPSGVIHVTFVAMTGIRPSTGGSAEYRVVDLVIATTGRHQFLYNVQPSGASEFGRGSSYSYSFDGKWQCAEWMLDPANQSFRFYLNGSEVTQIGFTNGAGNYSRSDIPNSFSSLKVGETHYQNSQSGFVVQFDELVLDARRIGCSN